MKTKFPNVIDFLKEASFTNVNAIKGHLSDEELICSKAIRLRELNLLYQGEGAKLLVSSYLISFSDLLNIKEDAKLDEFQIKFCTDSILRCCNGITIPELARFFTKILDGHYGTFYAQVDQMLICKWAREYMKERGGIIVGNPKIRSWYENRDD